MFARISQVSLFALFALPVLASASTLPVARSECSTGVVRCCNNVQTAAQLSQSEPILFGLLNVFAGPLTGLVGATCDPITGIGAAGTSCTSQTVCCENNSFNGVVAVGCTPININA